MGFMDGLKRIAHKTTPSHVESDAVCDDCRKIDLQAVSTIEGYDLHHPANERGVLIASLGTRCSRAPTNQCTLCELFYKVSAAKSSHSIAADIEQNYKLMVYSLLRHGRETDSAQPPTEIELEDVAFLAVVPCSPEGKIIGANRYLSDRVFCQRIKSKRTHSRIWTAEEIPRQFEAEIVLSWLDCCKTGHQGSCAKQSNSIKGLKLVECESLTVVSAPLLVEYAALSYVWRKVEPNQDLDRAPENNASLHNLSRAVSDALKVTLALGLKYLWVDKYCIDQADGTHKQQQLDQMDSIYNNAEITIIAAAGDDEDFGLPGVGSANRKPQPKARTGKVEVISLMAHPQDTIESSKWSTRGWTYQEGVLSRRRLFFTEDQMYFECGVMNRYESLKIRAKFLHGESQTHVMRPGMCSGVSLNMYQRIGIPRNLTQYMLHAQKFTSRELRYGSDSLRAFTGLTKHFERLDDPVYQICGIPFRRSTGSGGEEIEIPAHRAGGLPYMSAEGSADDIEVARSLIAGLLWVHPYEYRNISGQPTRRHGFPSWSWAGWKGAVQFLVRSLNPRVLYVNLQPSISDVFVEFQAGDVHDFNTLYQKIGSAHIDSSNIVSALHLHAWRCHSNDVSTPENAPSALVEFAGLKAFLYLTTGPETMDLVCKALVSQDWHVLLLAQDSIRCVLFFMLVRYHEDDTVTRAGSMIIEDTDLEKFREHATMRKQRYRLA